ncbi:terpene synthase [Nocardia terpenica]|uniref:Terpene synthase n=1 Tax=Nocardia terpenica TaxID=455432 RepID=A0A291RPH9_9NOCA|nr:terpene synthase [Nocardia terpenica]
MPAKLNPDYPTIYEHNADWVRRFLPFSDEQSISRILEARYPLSEALQFPKGLPGRIVHTSCVLSLMFQVEDLALLQRALFDDIAADWVAGHRYGPAFASAFGTLQRFMPVDVYRRYRKEWQNWFSSAQEENVLRDRGEIPDLDTCLEIRRLSIGMRPGLVGAEYVHDIDLTRLLKRDPSLVRAGHTAIEHIMLVNDLFSFRKEYFQGEYINVMASLLFTHQYSLQNAVDFVCRRIRDADEALANLCDELRLRYAWYPQVQTYLDTLGSICAGNLRWSLETTRYNGSGYGWSGLRNGRMTLHSDRTTIEEPG